MNLSLKEGDVMKKKYIFGSLVILLVGGVSWWYWHRGNAVPNVETISVVNGDIAETVSASAVLNAAQEINLNFEIAGRVRSIPVKEGQSVGMGDILATIDSVELVESVAKAKASLVRARADAMSKEDSIREARETEKNAKQYYETIQELENQKVKAADEAYDRAVEYKQDVESYYDQVVSDDGESSKAAKNAKLSLTSAKNAVSSADESRKTARKNRESAEQSAKNTWSSAQERVKTLESSTTDIIKNSDVRVAEANYAIALAGAEKGNLKAPVNGKVTRVNYHAGEVIGTSSAGFGRLLSYDFLLEAKIPESDIVRVKLGQFAHITFDSFETNDVFDAEVIEIESDATVIQDVVYYIAKLRLMNDDLRLKPGMSGDADIRIDEKKNVLKIPSRLILEEEGHSYVTIVYEDGLQEKREVKTGLRDDDGMVEVVSGLAVADRILAE